MKQADFVYEIVPKLGEYGFSTKPHSVSSDIEARVRSLAGSFQWRSAFSIGEHPVALAMDVDHPLLVASVTHDDHDPHRRTSLRLKVWIADSWDGAAAILSDVWPDTPLPASNQAFLEQARSLFDGDGGKRFVIGPKETFSAVDFAKAIGVAAATTEPPPAVSRRSPPSRHHSSSGGFAKGITVLTTLLCLLLGATCYLLFRENVAVDKHAADLANERDDLDKRWTDAAGTNTPDALRDRLTSLETAIRSWKDAGGVDTPAQLDDRMEKIVTAWQTAAGTVTPEQLQSRIASLEESASQDPERVDRQRLQYLSSLQLRVQRFIEQQRKALDGLEEETRRLGASEREEADRREHILNRFNPFSEEGRQPND